jgi:hypothetical protein
MYFRHQRLHSERRTGIDEWPFVLARRNDVVRIDNGAESILLLVNDPYIDCVIRGARGWTRRLSFETAGRYVPSA